MEVPTLKVAASVHPAILTLLVVALSLLYWRVRPRTGLPGPPSLPLIGSLPWIGSTPLDVKIVEWKARYGSPFQVDVGLRRYIIVAGSDAATLLMKVGKNREKDRPDLLFYSEALGTKHWFPPSESSNEPLVHVSRSLAGKLVKSIRFEPSQRASIECIRPLMPSIGTPIVMDDTVRAFTRTMALEIGFGIKLPRELIDSHQETKQLFSCVQDLLKLFDSTKECTVPFPFLEWLLPRRTSQKKKEAAEVYERFQHAASALSKQHDGHIRKGEGLLTTASQYHLAKEGDGTPDGPLSEQESVIQGAGIIAAVSDTTTTSLSTCLGCLAYDLESQTRVQTELDNAMKDSGGGCVLPTTEEEIMQPYLLAVLRESIRMYPFSPMGFPRRATADIVLDDGRVVPEGSIMLPHVDEVSKDATLFADDPRMWKPERQLGQAGSYPIFAFGFGGRACPGRELAVRNMMTFLARLLYLFEIRFEDHEAAVHGKTMEQILNHDTTTLMRRVNLPRFVLRPRFPTASVRTALEQTS